MLLVRAGRLATVSDKGVIDDACVVIRNSRIDQVGRWDELAPGSSDAVSIDARRYVVTPGLVDPHTHNIEFGAGTTWNVGQRAQLGGAASLLFDALTAGITALGEHILGHYEFSRDVSEYRRFANALPQRIKLAVGTCCVGTEPISYLSSLDPGGSRERASLFEPEGLKRMSELNEFPGENCFITSTPANLPVEVTPNADIRMIDRDVLKRIIDTYHAAGKRVGAHLEGLEPARDFTELGGDVIHHGFAIPTEYFAEMARNNVMLCATPGAGTGWQPNSPEELAAAVDAGVEVGIATDGVIPQSALATWLDSPPGTLIKTTDLLRVAAPGLRKLVSGGISPNDALALLTLNSAKILGLEDDIGSVEEGKYADLIFVEGGFPAIDVSDPTAVKAVMMEGVLVLGDLHVTPGVGAGA